MLLWDIFKPNMHVTYVHSEVVKYFDLKSVSPALLLLWGDVCDDFAGYFH